MALRIGPVGPVREAGLGSGAGLGSEVMRRALSGVAVYPRVLLVPSVSACLPLCLLTPVAVTHSKCGLASLISNNKPVGAAAVVESGSQRRARWAFVSFGSSRAPTRPPVPRSRTLYCLSACEKPSRWSQRSIGESPQGFTQRRSCVAGTLVVVRGSTARRAEGLVSWWRL